MASVAERQGKKRVPREGRLKKDSGGLRRGGRKKRRPRKQPLFSSFAHAFDGIGLGLHERNMQIHCAFAAAVVLFGLLLHISATEWYICLALFGLIMGLELVNTAVEAVVDLASPGYHRLARRAKDAAAGAVLIAAIMAAIIGLAIFVPRLLYAFRSMF